MSSGSLKDLVKAISASLNLSSPPIPSHLIQNLHEYVENFQGHDEEHAQRLQDELLAIYSTQVHNNPATLAPFLTILRILKPLIVGSGRLIQWWKTLFGPVIKNLSSQKGLAQEARDIILDLLVVDSDSKESEILRDQQDAAQEIQENLIKFWMVKSVKALQEIDMQARFVETQLLHILLSYGRRRPGDFLTCVNRFFITPSTRILALTLLGEFIRQQPPHLHLMLETPLFGNLLTCLQTDTSTRVISLAISTFVMFLPHIPSSLGPYLPALFHIYSRMLFWDRARKADEPTTDTEEEDDTNEKGSMRNSGWIKMSYLLESDDETVPELSHYFTFLYGLYPINFMSYIRKPQKYLRNASFAGADDHEIDPIEIHSRSEPFRQLHLLHPNFFHLTIESELTDTNRWINSEAADVVAECMGLLNVTVTQDKQESRTRGPTQKLNLDFPSTSLLGEKLLSPSRHNSKGSQQSTIPQDEMLQMTFSTPPPKSRMFGGDSPTLPAAGSDSPTIPPQMLDSTHQLSFLDTKRSSRTSGTSSVMSYSANPSVDNLYSLDRELPRNLTQLVTADVKIAYLHREIQLLQNDLKLEQYFKAQHLSHIVHLRAKQLREATVEAETQNLINSNKHLKSKLHELKMAIGRIRTETEKSKAHARHWEENITERYQSLRDKGKTIVAERDDLKRQLEIAQRDLKRMRMVVVQSESQELTSRLSGLVYEAATDELNDLRAENSRLTSTIRKYELNEELAVKLIETEGDASERVEQLEQLLQAKEAELEISQAFFVKKLRENSREASIAYNARIKEMHDSALLSERSRAMASERRFLELQKEFDAYHRRHSNTDMRSETTQSPLLSPSRGHFQNAAGSPVHRAFTTPDPDPWDRAASMISDSMYPDSPVHRLQQRSRTDPMVITPERQAGYDYDSAPRSPNTQHSGLSPTKSEYDYDQIQARPSRQSSVSRGQLASPKADPPHATRMYGRGGSQNASKVMKDAAKSQDGGKKGSSESDSKDKKKGTFQRALGRVLT